MYEELTVYDDNNEKVIEPPRFLLMNKVCSEHISLASTERRSDHDNLAKYAAGIIEEAKQRNIRTIDDRISNEEDSATLGELVQIRAQIVQHNEKITNEWAQLTSRVHAFDSHIHAHLRQQDVPLAAVESTAEPNG